MILFLLVLLTGCINNDKPKEDDPTKVKQEYVDQTIYTLDVTFDEVNSSLVVIGTIQYKVAEDNFNELYLMFYPNAVSEFIGEDNVKITSLIINSIVYFEREFENANNTALHIPLEELYNTNDILTIEFEYSFEFWTYDRIYMNYTGDYMVSMFFYPFVAIHDETGWNIEPYTYAGETYYNEVGTYDVTLHMPETFIVASGGMKNTETTSKGVTTYNYYMEDARDYSFSASTNYHIYEKTILGIDMDIYSIEPLSSLELNTSWAYLENSFSLFEETIGDYYFDNFVLEYGEIYGMESTGIIYCDRDINEETVVHEVAHMWFFSMIGNDQYDESFLDESITTYITATYYRNLYGVEGYDNYLLRRSSLQSRLSNHYDNSLGDSLLRNVNEFGNLYGFKIYYHGTTMIDAYINTFLEDDVDEFVRILSIYYDEYNKDIATVEDFLALLEEESGVEETTEWFMMHLQEIQDLSNRP